MGCSQSQTNREVPSVQASASKVADEVAELTILEEAQAAPIASKTKAIGVPLPFPPISIYSCHNYCTSWLQFHLYAWC